MFRGFTGVFPYFYEGAKDVGTEGTCGLFGLLNGDLEIYNERVGFICGERGVRVIVGNGVDIYGHLYFGALEYVGCGRDTLTNDGES